MCVCYRAVIIAHASACNAGRGHCISHVCAWCRVVIVITDGQATSGYEPADEAKLLHDIGVAVLAIGTDRF